MVTLEPLPRSSICPRLTTPNDWVCAKPSNWRRLSSSGCSSKTAESCPVNLKSLSEFSVIERPSSASDALLITSRSKSVRLRSNRPVPATLCCGLKNLFCAIINFFNVEINGTFAREFRVKPRLHFVVIGAVWKIFKTSFDLIGLTFWGNHQ